MHADHKRGQSVDIANGGDASSYELLARLSVMASLIRVSEGQGTIFNQNSPGGKARSLESLGSSVRQSSGIGNN